MSPHDRARSASPSSKKRIRVACTTCRKKKIKCDGAVPCVNCTISKEPNCTYDEKPTKQLRKKSRVTKSDEVLTHLNSRLDRLEAMIRTVAGSVPGATESLKIKQESARSSTRSTDNEDEDHWEVSRDDDTQSPSAVPVSDSAKDEPKQNEIYLGNHSFFSILSKSSISWMKAHLSEDDLHLLVPLSNLPYVFENKMNSFSGRWFDMKRYENPSFLESMRSPLPKKKEPMWELMEQFSRSFCTVQILCSGEEIKHALKRYYSTSNPNKRHLSMTQLFKLYTSLLICLSDAIEAYFGGCLNNSKSTPLQGLTLHETHALRDKLIEVCMGFYFQLSLKGSGLEVMRSLLFFVSFLAKCHDPPEITLSILSTAIRKGLDMGLHRIETYRSCTPEEFQLRMLVWRLASYVDLEMCFRAGKPPIINYNDVSPELKSNLPSTVNQNFYALPHMTNYDRLFQIRLETYNRLFSAMADTKTFGALQRNVDFLNSMMFDLLPQIPLEDRPFFYNEPGFREVTQMSGVADEHRITAILTFFCNMMTINRLPSMFALPGASTEVLQMYKNLSLNSARSILHMLKNFRPYGPGKATSLWITFFPLISVLHLSAACMSDPNSADSHSDILLIAKMCETWFNRSVAPDSMRSFKFDMTILLEVLVKSVSSIAISIFERNTGIQILALNPKIKLSLEAPLKILPELFENEEILKKAIPLVFESKSPFSHSTSCSPSTNGKVADPTYPDDPPSSTSSFSEDHMRKASGDYGVFGGVFDSGTNFGGLDNLLFDQLDQYPNLFFDGMGNIN